MYLVNTSELHMLVFDTGLSVSLAYLQGNKQGLCSRAVR